MASGLTALGSVYSAVKGGGGGSSTETATMPAWQQQQFQDYYNRAKGVSQQPFIPYTGAQVAGFNPDQLRQFQATRGIFESGMGYDPTKALQGMAQEQFKPTIQPVTGFQAPTIEATQAPGAAQIGPVSTPQFRGLLSQDIGAYQSPYQQQVIDLAMGDIQRQADIARGGAQDRAIRSGAFGGSRSAILEAESQRPYVEQMARTSAGLRQSGFEQAQAAAERDVARQQQMQMFAPELELRARQQQAGLLGGLQGQQVQGLGLLGQAGAQQQALQQRAIDAQRGEFQRALGYGPQQIGLLQAGMGTPLISQTTTGQQKTGAGDVLGTAAQLAGMYFMGQSDERLKENIKPIGKSENGHNVYTWDWNDKAKELGVNDPTTGVLAQEVMKYMPEAVSKHANGYYMVNYGVL